MLGENIRQLRKKMGMTQEELALRLHVVRQTVSKWEKGLSVPDAEMLQKLAGVLEVPVDMLLDGELPSETEENEIAAQLSGINAQLAMRNRRARRIWTIVGIVLAAWALFFFLSVLLSTASYNNRMSTAISMSTEDPLYFEAEVQEAFDALRAYFRRECKGCTLKALAYNEDDSLALLSTEDDEVERIVLLVTFTTNVRAERIGLTPNATYRDRPWVLTRTAGGPWTVQTEAE